MPARHYDTFLLSIPEATRLASLGGISNDLEGVVGYCKYLDEHSEIERWNFIVWEAMSSAAVVRYARCFASGVRTPLPPDFFSAATKELQDFHEYILAVRSKHVAHSVNDFEENEVVVQVGAHFTSSAEIEAINPSHSRLLGLAFGDTRRLTELAQWVLARVQELVEHERRQLLPIVRAIPLEHVKEFGRAELGRGGNREKVSTRRKRP